MVFSFSECLFFGFTLMLSAHITSAKQAEVVFTNCTEFPFYVTTNDVSVCECRHTLNSDKGNYVNWTLLWLDPYDKIIANTSLSEKQESLTLHRGVIRADDSQLPFKCVLLKNGKEKASRKYVPFLRIGPQDARIASSHEFVPENGEKMTLTVTVSASPVPVFEWQGRALEDEILPGREFGKALHSQSLRIEATKYKDGHIIWCKIKNGYDPTFTETVSFVLRYERKAELTHPCFKWPQYVVPNDTLACTCKFVPPVTSLRRTWRMHWEDSRGYHMTQLNSTGDVITLQLHRKMIKRNESGRPFLCVVSTENGTFSNVTYVPFLAYGPREVSLVSEQPYIPADDSNVTLTCCAKVNPEPIFRWQGHPSASVKLPGCASSRQTFVRN